MKTVVFCIALLFLAGCATQPPAAPVLVPTPVPCPAAQDLPEDPPRTLDLTGRSDGQVAQAYAANRRLWIGTATALRARLEACRK